MNLAVATIIDNPVFGKSGYIALEMEMTALTIPYRVKFKHGALLKHIFRREILLNIDMDIIITMDMELAEIGKGAILNDNIVSPKTYCVALGIDIAHDVRIASCSL
ncbi:MAG: hypothetical protein J1E42_08185 [Akkermansiaceae bacterium]|nr:hypothetical protein [Akkermansiaceae bacterium]